MNSLTTKLSKVPAFLHWRVGGVNERGGMNSADGFHRRKVSLAFQLSVLRIHWGKTNPVKHPLKKTQQINYLNTARSFLIEKKPEHGRFILLYMNIFLSHSPNKRKSQSFCVFLERLGQSAKQSGSTNNIWKGQIPFQQWCLHRGGRDSETESRWEEIPSEAKSDIRGSPNEAVWCD